MNTQMIMMALLFIIVVAGMWQARKMKNMVFCTYTSRSNQTWDKVIKEQTGYVVFEGKKFYLLPQYARQKQYDKGLSSFFPTKISAYEFVWNSSYPIDHKTGKPAMLSPEVRNALNQEGALFSYAGSQQRVMQGKAGKLGGLEKWTPYIMIVLAIAVGYLIYTNMTSSSNDKTTQQAIIDIYNTFNKYNMQVTSTK